MECGVDNVQLNATVGNGDICRQVIITTELGKAASMFLAFSAGVARSD